jgi:nitrite reductase (NADH) small subunit
MNLAITWTDLGPLDSIPRQGSRTLSSTREPVAVFRTHDDQVFALIDRCPHKHGPLSQGIVHGRAVTCPLHNWVIDLASGEAQGPDEGCSGTLPVRLDNGRVLIALGTLGGGNCDG